MSADPARPYRIVPGGLLLAVRLTPKAAKDEIGSVELLNERPVVRARVRAVPEKGKANSALEKLVANWLKLPRSRVALSTGGRSRLKMLMISGDGELLAVDIDRRLDQVKPTTG